MIGQVFTNADHAVRKEEDCYAYQVISDNNGTIEAVQLKVKTIKEPTRLKIDKLSSTGKKKIEFPLVQTDIIEIFTLTTFGKRKCIMNKDKCLIQLISFIQAPLFVNQKAIINHKVELELLPITLIKDIIIEESLLIRACKLLYDYTPIIIDAPVMFIDPAETVEWLTCRNQAFSTVKDELNKLTKLKNEKDEELKRLNLKIQALTVESQERCKHQVRIIEYANLNCKIKYCTYCKVKL